MERKLENIIGFFIGILTLGMARSIFTQIHHEMVDKFVRGKVIKSNFKTFRNEFKTVDWELLYTCGKDLFTNDQTSLFHASIIKINNVGYKLTTYGLIRAYALRNKKVKELNKINHM
jgi:hypothetical protein